MSSQNEPTVRLGLHSEETLRLRIWLLAPVLPGQRCRRQVLFRPGARAYYASEAGQRREFEVAETTPEALAPQSAFQFAIARRCEIYSRLLLYRACYALQFLDGPMR
jgi:hypothetical protein